MNIRKTSNKKLYISMVSIHGLLRGENMELGRDADTGGQIKYVVEMATALSKHARVGKVDVLTRKVMDKKVDDIYAASKEPLSENGHIIRLECGPKRYIRKELLWPYLDEFVDNALKHFRYMGRIPDLIHGHYADAGYVSAKLSMLLGIPMVFTGHSLGRIKQERLLANGLLQDTIEKRYNIAERIEAEEFALMTANKVITSTNQEVEEQYSRYQHYAPEKKAVVPPGTDLKQFYPPTPGDPSEEYEAEINRFLRDPQKPIILALSRPDERKNITTLIEAYAKHESLRDMANLVVIAGNRDDIEDLDSGSKKVLQSILHLIDKYDLYGSVAYPKHHQANQVPCIYRIASKTHGVFVNPALTEPFGLTLIEATASGLPLVATNDGGPSDIIGNCRNGILIDPLNQAEMADAIYTILSNPRRWTSYSKNGLKNVEKYYAWESHVKSYLQEVQPLVKSGKTQPFWITSGKKLLQADRMLISDIDNTLTGDDEALDRLSDWLKTRDKRRIGFCVNTGRHIESAQEILEEKGVPQPDIFITSVGSEIHYGHDISPDKDWARHINYRWHPERIQELMENYDGVQLQEEDNQREFKVSYYVDTEIAPPVKEIIRDCRKNKISVRTIFSHGQFLDFLPMRASKGLAVWYLSNKWGIPMERIVVAGDSGNDQEMLETSALSIVVGNFSPELKKLQGKSRIYFAKASFAKGIFEGMDYYDFRGSIRIPEEVTDDAS